MRCKLLTLLLLLSSQAFGQVAYVGKTDTDAVAGDTLTVQVGSPTEDNFLLMVIGYKQGDQSITSPPSGWTELAASLAQGSAAATSAEAYLYYKIAGASESNPTVTRSGTGNTSFDAVVHEFSGVDTTTPLDGVTLVTDFTNFGTTADSPTITPNTDAAWWISGVIHDDNDGAATRSDGTTTLIESVNITAYWGYALARKEIDPAGATGANTWTVSSDERLEGFSFALKPAAGGGGGSVPVFENHYRSMR